VIVILYQVLSKAIFFWIFLSFVALGVLVIQSFLAVPIYEFQFIPTISNYLEIFNDPLFAKAFINTVIAATLTMVIATVGAFLLAFAIHKLDLGPMSRFTRALEPIILITLLFPSVVWALAWLYAYGPYTTIPWLKKLWGEIYGVIPASILNGILHISYAYVIIVPALLSLDSTFEEAARVHGARLSILLFKVIFPMLRPAIIAAAIYIFIIGFESVGIYVALANPVNEYVLMTFILSIGLSPFQVWSFIAAGATIIVLLTLTLIILQRYLILRYQRRYAVITGRFREFSKIKVSKRVAVLVFASILTFVVLTILIPIIALVIKSFTSITGSFSLYGYEVVLGSRMFMNIITNTVLVALMATAIGVPLFFGYGLAILRSRSPMLSRISDIGSTIPRAMPGLILGLAMLWVYLFTPLRPLLYTLLGLAIVYLVSWSALGVRIVVSNLIQISPEVEEVARVHGASQSTTLVRITMPLVKRTLLLLFFVLSAHGIREYTIPVFLSTPQTQVLGATILMAVTSSGQMELAATLSVIQIAIILVVTVVLFKLGWKPYRELH